MRRRTQEPAEGDAPLRLRRYNAADWGGGKEAPQRFWDAHDAWRDEHGEDVEIDPDSEQPDVPFDRSMI